MGQVHVRVLPPCGARMVNLAADDATDCFTRMEVIMCQWRRISALLDEKGPFIYAVTRTTMRALDLASL
jgi:hypothetical protein